jgi:hypothetical protein
MSSAKIHFHFLKFKQYKNIPPNIKSIPRYDGTFIHHNYFAVVSTFNQHKTHYACDPLSHKGGKQKHRQVFF